MVSIRCGCLNMIDNEDRIELFTRNQLQTELLLNCSEERWCTAGFLRVVSVRMKVYPGPLQVHVIPSRQAGFVHDGPVQHGLQRTRKILNRSRPARKPGSRSEKSTHWSLSPRRHGAFRCSIRLRRTICSRDPAVHAGLVNLRPETAVLLCENKVVNLNFALL